MPYLYSLDPDQSASEDANWSGSALFVIQYVYLYHQSGSDWLTVRRHGILIHSAWQGQTMLWDFSAPIIFIFLFLWKMARDGKWDWPLIIDIDFKYSFYYVL